MVLQDFQLAGMVYCNNRQHCHLMMPYFIVDPNNEDAHGNWNCHLQE
jgi:hypothetical protein